jgi:hypothetical protein
MRFDDSSDTWQFIAKWIDSKIDSLRKDNDALKLDEITTAALRGKIAAFKEVADLPKTLSRETASKTPAVSAGEDY